MENSKKIRYEWYYDKSLPYFSEYNLELQYTDSDSIIFSFKPHKELNQSLKHFKEKLLLSDLDLSRKLLPKDLRKVSRKLKFDNNFRIGLE